MPPIIAIQFNPVGRRYHFDAQGITDFQPGDRVVVETARGIQLGIVVDYVPKEKLGARTCKAIERRATASDLAMQQQWDSQALHALVSCREQAKRLGIKGCKFFRAEYNFNGSRVTILYTTEKKHDNLRLLQRELRRSLRTRVELYKIGPRDVAKLLDGLGACGSQRCCARFLTRFNPVSIRMAKLQQIALTPSEITGVCGRLRCCLAYEHELYVEESKGLPKRGKEVLTPYGKGRVVEVRTLAGVIVVEVEGVRHVVQREDIGKQEFTHPPVEKEVWPDWLPKLAEPQAEEREPQKGPKQTPAGKKPRRSSRGRRRRSGESKKAGAPATGAAKPKAPQKSRGGRRSSGRQRQSKRPSKKGNEA